MLAASIAKVGSAIKLFATSSLQRNVTNFQRDLFDVESELLGALQNSARECLLRKQTTERRSWSRSLRKRLGQNKIETLKHLIYFSHLKFVWIFMQIFPSVDGLGMLVHHNSPPASFVVLNLSHPGHGCCDAVPA